MTGRLSRSVLLIGILLLVTQLLLAQTPLGRLAGVVHDTTGAVIANATVTAINEGTQLQQTTKSSSVGAFVFPQLPAGSYTVKVEAQGFKASAYTQVKIDPSQEYSLTATLSVGKAAEVVEVVAGVDLVQTTTAENNNTVSSKQLLSLPVLNRDITNVIKMQAGVTGIYTRTTTGVNGGRPEWTAVTQDGINIQDNYIRNNALDFLPSRPTQDSVSEMTVTTSNQGVDATGGASQVKMVTPSGTNAYHGSVYEFNRNSAVAANSWMNNNLTDKNGNWAPAKVPFLNQNQFGGRIGGPILKKKLFFFGFYEGYRRASTASQTNTIVSHDDYYNGAFRYLSGGVEKTVNVLQLANGGAGASIDPTIKKLILDPLATQRPSSLVNTSAAGDCPSLSVLLNTCGYRFNQAIHNKRDQVSDKIDYEFNSKHHFEFSHNYTFENNGRSDIDYFNTSALAYQQMRNSLYVGAWRWTVSPKLQNEVRIGGYYAFAPFEPNQEQGSFFLSESTSISQFLNGLAVTDPLQTFMRQGRYTDTMQYMDNASYVTGNHFFRFGGSLQTVRVHAYNDASIIPVMTTGVGFAPAGYALVGAQLPGASSNALNQANALLGFLTGSVTSISQNFNVASRTSGYVKGQGSVRNWINDEWSIYFQDSWKVKSNLTVTYGLKWDYFPPVKEANGLTLLPQATAGLSVKDIVLNPNAVLDWSPSQGLWKPRKNGFGPSLGFAYDPFKDGKTSIRGGYTLSYVHDSDILAANNAVNNNSGLSSSLSASGYFTNLTTAPPSLSAPAFKVPRTLADQMALSIGSADYMIDPNLKQPYVNEFSFGIQRELPKDMSVEVRYAGSMGKQLLRGVDFNQNNVGINQPFLADFNRARSNGYLALAASGSFNPAYNPAIVGSQPLPIISTIGTGSTAGGYLGSSTVRGYIQNGQVADLADYYAYYRLNFPTAPAYFLNNPGIYVADALINGGNSNYNALQTELKRRMKQGLTFQINYTYSKVLANQAGTSQNRLEPLLDNARPGLEKKVADFDVRHIINANYVYELPFGRGKRFMGDTPIVKDMVGGWQMSSIVHWQSGSPFNIMATYGTFNRSGRSGMQTPTSPLTQSQIAGLMGLYQDPKTHTLYWINPSVVDTNGSAIGTKGVQQNYGPAFANQVFFEPAAGQIGSLGRCAFYGPSQFTWDFSMRKSTRITERFNTEFAADFFNVFNHPNFWVGDYNVTSANFGKITGMNTAARIMQFSIRVNF